MPEQSITEEQYHELCLEITQLRVANEGLLQEIERLRAELAKMQSQLETAIKMIGDRDVALAKRRSSVRSSRLKDELWKQKT